MSTPIKRRRLWVLLVVVLLGLAVWVGWPVVYLFRFIWNDTDQIGMVPPGYADDVSRMNRVSVSEVWKVPTDRRAAEEQLRELFMKAGAAGLHVSIAGAKHSMGGHTIYPGGVVIDMLPLNGMDLDEDKNILHVQSGAKWSEIIPYLDRRGRSIEVMQSDNSFTVGGSLSVNCHGWQYNRPPISSTVVSFRLMKADGTIVQCSRTENAELFSLVLGGYGLFGVLLDVDLRVVSNERLCLEQYVVSTDTALESFGRKLQLKPGVCLVYARLNIRPDTLFKDVVISMFYPDAGGPIPDLSAASSTILRRAVFRGSAESEYGKKLRWEAETKVQPLLLGKIFSRNQLLNDSVDWYLNRTNDSTDILHEYFVPPAGTVEFLSKLREIVSRCGGNLLNVTVREINTDEDTFLRYADQPMIAFVLYFSQPRTDAGDAEMQKMTQEIIESALRVGGRYYLPYRLHATVDQMRRAYPRAREFFQLKREHDPKELFQNQFYVKYGKD